jgi:DNA-directed RNA polymerase specialized sigma24 family protein
MSKRGVAQSVSIGSAYAESVAPDLYLYVAITEANRRTRHARWTAGLTEEDGEDLFQEILVDLLQRRARFDPTRGSEGAFAGTIAANRAADFLSALQRDRQRLSFVANDDLEQCLFSAEGGESALAEVPFNDVDDATSVTDCVRSSFRLAEHLADETDLFQGWDLARDFEIAVSLLSDEQVTLLELLKTHSDLSLAAKASGMSPATFYRRVSDLVMYLRMFGIKAGG